MRAAIFFPRVILYNFFLFWLIYGSLGFRGWGLRLGFWGWGFQLMGFGACGVGPSGFLGWGSLYKHKRITLGKKWCVRARASKVIIPVINRNYYSQIDDID